MKTETNATPCIIQENRLSPGQLRYWKALARKMSGRVNLVDPWRWTLKDLRAKYPAGYVVYRASTGGKWGRSSEIVTL